MTIPIQSSKLQSAVQSALPDVGQFMQRDAAQCNSVRRASDEKCETNPPREARSIKRILSPRQLMAISLLLAGRQVQRRAELADPVQRRRSREVFTPHPIDPDVDSDRRGGQKSLAELRESNRRLFEKLVRQSSGRR